MREHVPPNIFPMSTAIPLNPLVSLVSDLFPRNRKQAVARKRSTSHGIFASNGSNTSEKEVPKTKDMLENGEAIWYRLCEGDSSAMGELYDAIGSAMFSLSFRILNDRWEAEEVVQDVLTNLWKNPTAYSPERGKLHSWLFTYTRNRSIDRYRSRRRRKDNEEMDEVTLNTRADPVAADAGKHAESSDDQVALRQALTHIGEKQRHVLELSFFKGMTHAEIALDTGLSLGTVKSRIRLGLDKLRGQLAGLR